MKEAPEISDLKDLLPPYMCANKERTKAYTDFLVCYLADKRDGSRRVDELFLKLNKAYIDFELFMEKQNAVDFGFAKVIKQTSKYAKLKITDSGMSHYKYLDKRYKTKSVTFIHRIIKYVLEL